MAKKVSEFGRLLNRLLSETGTEQVELAQKTGLSKYTISKHVTGNADSPPQASTFIPIAQHFGLSVEDVRAVVAGKKLASEIRIDRDAESLPLGSDARIIETLTESPLLIAKLAAGTWTQIDDFSVDGDGMHVRSRGIATMQREQGLFRIQISGDSMEDKYPDGSILMFKSIDLSREALRPGRDYYFQLRDGRATFKRLSAATEDVFILKALNRKKYPKPMEFPCDMLARAAIAVHFMQPVRWENE